MRGAGEHLSPEVNVPKLMWLNETYGAAWMERVGLALGLVDFLTLKCTSALERSMNSFSCKFLYQPPPAGPGWDVGFYRAIRLETLLEKDAAHIEARAQYPGDTLRTGVSSAARATRRRNRRRTGRQSGVQWVRA